MKKPIKISVIVPVYNMELYLEKCLHSLLKQTYPHTEIVVVDDGSKDSSWTLLQQFADQPNVHLYQKENGGLSDARNFGIAKASGDYLAFVDSDDWVEDTFLETLFNLAEKHQAEMVICNLQKVDETEKPFNFIDQLTHLPEKITLKEDFSLFGEVSSFACNKLFKRALFDNEEFPLRLHFEDIATIPQLILKCRTIAKTDQYLYNYFERSGSITQSFNERGMDMFKAIDLVQQAFEKSIYSNHKKEWQRFVIYQGYYSLLAYIIRVEDKTLRQHMYAKLNVLLNENGITKTTIFQYKRLGKNYLLSLDFKKKVFYGLMLMAPKFTLKK